MPGSVTDMSESADLGVIEAKTDPSVAYHKVHAARMSAQRAFCPFGHQATGLHVR